MNTDFVALTREQFTILRDAKREVKKEFNEDLVLADKDVLMKLYEFALESKGESLFAFYEELRSGIDKQKAETKRRQKRKVAGAKTSSSIPEPERSERKVAEKLVTKVKKPKELLYYRGALVKA